MRFDVAGLLFVSDATLMRELSGALLEESSHSASEERTLIKIVAVFAMTFEASPAWIVLTVTTAVCVGSTLRVTIDCSVTTRLQATRTDSP